MNHTQMHIAASAEQTCCTCAYWAGIRLKEKDGHVYALEGQEGLCDSIARVLDGNAYHGALTVSRASCPSWRRWSELNTPRGNFAYGPAEERYGPRTPS